MKPEILSRQSAEKLALFDRLKIGKIGDIVPWHELEAVIGCPVRSGSPGYQSLYGARKKVLREVGLVWEPLADHSGLKCLNGQEVLMLGVSALKRIQRGARRANFKLSAVDPTTLNQQDHLRLLANRSLLAVLESSAKTSSLQRIEAAGNAEMKPLPPARILAILQ